MTEQSAEYRAQAERLKAGHNHGMMPLTPQERAFLLELRSGLLHGLVMIERKLGCESSVKTRADTRHKKQVE